jgi:hypothetical protein
VSGLATGWRRLSARLARAPWLAGRGALDLVATMTLILLLIYSEGVWFVRLPLTLLAIAALLFPGLRLDRRLWLTAALVLLAGNLWTWYDADNHQYVIAYWCLALALALGAGTGGAASTRSANDSLAQSARWIVGLSFLFATAWKLHAPDYLDGTFFHFALLADSRFHDLSVWLGDLRLAELQANRTALETLLHPAGDLTAVEFSGSTGIRRLAVGMTWWTVAIEALVAAAFLSPAGSLPYRIRDGLLLAFILTTYLFAPVTGFGWVLLVMGFAQTPRGATARRLAYVALFLALQLYRAPWPRLVDWMLGS